MAALLRFAFRREQLVPVAVAGTGIAATTAFASVTPLPALTALAAVTLAPRAALLVALAAWAATQIVAYFLLGYTWTAETVIGAVAVGVMVAIAGGVAVAVARLSWRTLIACLGALLILALAGTDEFAQLTVGRLAVTTLIWAGVLAASWVWLRRHTAMTAVSGYPS